MVDYGYSGLMQQPGAVDAALGFSDGIKKRFLHGHSSLGQNMPRINHWCLIFGIIFV
jgi:hypothetical protein